MIPKYSWEFQMACHPIPKLKVWIKLFTFSNDISQGNEKVLTHIRQVAFQQIMHYIWRKKVHSYISILKFVQYGVSINSKRSTITFFQLAGWSGKQLTVMGMAFMITKCFDETTCTHRLNNLRLITSGPLFCNSWYEIKQWRHGFSARLWSHPWHFPRLSPMHVITVPLICLAPSPVVKGITLQNHYHYNTKYVILSNKIKIYHKYTIHHTHETRKHLTCSSFLTSSTTFFKTQSILSWRSSTLINASNWIELIFGMNVSQWEVEAKKIPDWMAIEFWPWRCKTPHSNMYTCAWYWNKILYHLYCNTLDFTNNECSFTCNTIPSMDLVCQSGKSSPNSTRL